MDDLIDANKRVGFGVPQKREEVTSILNECYSMNYLDLEEFEKRIDHVHAARTIADVEAVIADVPEDFKGRIKTAENKQIQLKDTDTVIITSSVKRMTGSRLLSKSLNLDCNMGQLRMDYRTVDLPAGIIEISLKANMSVCRIIVPPDVAVEEELQNERSVVRYSRSRRFNNIPIKTVIRITGNAVASVIRIKTRKKRVSRSSLPSPIKTLNLPDNS